jgi:ABC-2 type transport system ATP-binding protein
MSTAAPIETHNLVRKFGDLEAVAGVDLRVESGEVFGFLGPNGAGKTTIVRMLTTLLRPTSGEAFVGGMDIVKQASEVRRTIGVALQDASVDPTLTGRELVRLQATLYGLSRTARQTRGEELLERVGLSAAADRRVGTYSGGMRRRLDLALSLVHEPTVLFLDEPTTGLDPMSRISLWDEVRRLNNEGTTVFLTTQYLEEADELCNRIAIIDGGKIVREGVPSVLKKAVGCPTLRVELLEKSRSDEAAQVLSTFGDLRPAQEGRIAVGLEAGASAMADVVRQLDEAGLVVEHMELDAPSLDDVFAEATGRRLEGSDTEADVGIEVESDALGAVE